MLASAAQSGHSFSRTLLQVEVPARKSLPGTSKEDSKRSQSFVIRRGFLTVLGIALVFPVLSLAQAPPRPPRPARPDREEILAQVEALQLQQQAPGGEATVYVEEATGIDTPQCGSQAQPCRSITQGVKRARQIQEEDRSGTVILVNVEVGAGTYAEGVDIKFGWIRLRGAGVGMSTIANPSGYAVYIQAGIPVFLEGFTLSGTAGLGTVQAWDEAGVDIQDCEFRDSPRALYVLAGSRAAVRNTTFSNNHESAIGDQHTQLFMRNVVITGDGLAGGSGFTLYDNSVGTIQNTTISQTEVAVTLIGSEVWNFPVGSPATLTNNAIGLYMQGNSLADFGATISNNTDSGVVVEDDSVAILRRSTVSSNGTGIHVTGNSYLNLVRTTVTGNDTGIFFDLFSHGVLRLSTMSGNTTDIATDRGGAFFTEP